MTETKIVRMNKRKKEINQEINKSKETKGKVKNVMSL